MEPKVSETTLIIMEVCTGTRTFTVTSKAKKVNVMCILLHWNLLRIVFQSFETYYQTPLKDKIIISHFMLMAKKNLNSMILFGKNLCNLFVQTKLDSINT
jgi:hypothetical protein